MADEATVYGMDKCSRRLSIAGYKQIEEIMLTHKLRNLFNSNNFSLRQFYLFVRNLKGIQVKLYYPIYKIRLRHFLWKAEIQDL